MGPIGLLLQTANMQAAALDEKGLLHRWDEQGVDLLNVPYQFVAPTVRRICAGNRTKADCGTRRINQELAEIDVEVTTANDSK